MLVTSYREGGGGGGSPSPQWEGGGGGARGKEESSVHDLKTRHAVAVEKNQLNMIIQEQ